MNILIVFEIKNGYNHLNYSHLVKIVSKNVELQGVEPWSKHIRRKPSTCLS